jgi:superfamily II DNA or RNA helicase
MYGITTKKNIVVIIHAIDLRCAHKKMDMIRFVASSKRPANNDDDDDAADAASSKKPKRRNGRPVFSQNPWLHSEYHELAAVLRADNALLDRCVLDSAFRIPTKGVPTTVLNMLKRVLTTNPKLTYNPVTGKMENKPWKMYNDEVRDVIAIPRRVGVDLFGRPPPRVDVSTAAPLTEIPNLVLPLLNKEAAAEMFKVDQETAVACTVEQLDTMRESYGFGAGVFCIPTGNGKTCCAWALVAHYKMRTLFVVPNIKLMPQFVEEARKFLGPDVVVETMHTSQKSKRKAEKNMGVHIVITTFASAATIPYDMTGFGMVVVDEGHETMSPQNFHMFLAFRASVVVVLTATPERSNDCGCYLEWAAGDMCYYEEVDVAESQWGGIDVRKIPFVYPSKAPIKERYKSYGGRSVLDMEGLTQQIVHRKDRNEVVCGIIAEKVREGRHILIVCTRIAHLEVMQGLLVRAGVDVGIMIGAHSDGSPPTKEEDEHGFKCRVLLAQIRMAHRALNIPRLNCVGFLCGGAWNNLTFWTQLVGRVFRSVEGKMRPEILLFSDESNDGKLSTQVDKAIKTIRKLSTTKEAIREIVDKPVLVGK